MVIMAGKSRNLKFSKVLKLLELVRDVCNSKYTLPVKIATYILRTECILLLVLILDSDTGRNKWVLVRARGALVVCEGSVLGETGFVRSHNRIVRSKGRYILNLPGHLAGVLVSKSIKFIL